MSKSQHGLLFIDICLFVLSGDMPLLSSAFSDESLPDKIIETRLLVSQLDTTLTENKLRGERAVITKINNFKIVKLRKFQAYIYFRSIFFLIRAQVEQVLTCGFKKRGRHVVFSI